MTPTTPTPLVPKWIRQIIDNPSLLSEFISDMAQRQLVSIREGVKASKEGNHSEANILFGKAEAFESLRNSVSIHMKESEAQHAFQSQQTGNTGTSRKRARKGRSSSE